MNVGTRVVIIGHPLLHPRELRGYEGVVVGTGPFFYHVKMAWRSEPFVCIPEIVCPVYRDCERCGYAAYGYVTEDRGKRDPIYHHFCDWCLQEARGLGSLSACHVISTT